MKTPGPDEFDFLQQTLDSIVPFARSIGVAVVEVGDGVGRAALSFSETTANHVGTMHAGALFTVAEAASGAAMAGAMAPVVAESVSVVKTSTCRYLKAARTSVTARATTSDPGPAVRSVYDASGRVEFTVDVEVLDAEELVVAEMTFDWVVRAAS